MEQSPRQRGRPSLARQTSMQARQAQIEKIVEQQQATALILERVTGRLDALERWQEAEERAKERQEERRDDRDERRPDDRRANLALLLSAASGIVYVLTFLAQHWKP